MTRKKSATVLAHKKSHVTLHRNGLTIEVTDVSAEDCGLAAKELLDVMRTLAGVYPELIPDAGSLHAGSLGEFPDDDVIEPAQSDPPVMRTPKKIGF
jgi:hypothetical protein